MNELIADEFGRAIEEASRTAAGPNGRAVIVARVSATVRGLRTSPLVHKVLDVDPELLLPYLINRLGTTQRHALDLIAVDVDLAQRDGSARAGDPRTIALSLLLLAQTFVFFRPLSTEVSEAALLSELEVMIDGALRPTGGTR